MAREPRVLGIVLAGGEGKRLWPLTADRAKPAVPFGGNYRLIDFVLSNLVNAGYLRICVLTQYKSHSLDRHITQTWRMSTVLGDYVTPVPAQQRLGPRWYTGSADAILQSSNLIYDDKPDYIVVFGADHVYRMDPRQMVAQHIESGAGATVAGIRVPRTEATAFGVIDAAPDGKVNGFLEKPADPPGLPDSPDEAYASMGNYVFTTAGPARGAARGRRGRGLGARHGRQHHADDGQAGRRPTCTTSRTTTCPAPRSATAATGATSGRSTPTTTRTWTSSPCTRSSTSTTSSGRSTPTTRSCRRRSSSRAASRRNRSSAPARSSSGATVRHSVIAPNVRLHAGAYVEGSVLMDGVQIGRGAVVRRAILDKDVVVPEGAHIGVDHELDRVALPRLRRRRRRARQVAAGAARKWQSVGTTSPTSSSWTGLAPLDGTSRPTRASSGSAGRVWPRSTRSSNAGCRSSPSMPAGSPPARPGATAGSWSVARTRTCTRRSRRGARTPRSGSTARTLRELDRLAELLPDVVRRVGSIRLAGLPGDPQTAAEAVDRAAEIADCERHEAALREHGIAVERYDGALGTGLFLPDDAAMNPARRAIGLASQLRGRAALHEHTRVTSVERGAVRHRARHDQRRRRPRRRRRPARPARARAGRSGAHRAAADGRDRAGARRAAAVPGVRPVGLRLRAAGRRRAGVLRRRPRPVRRRRVDARRRAVGAGAGLHRRSRRRGWPARTVAITHRWAASVGFTVGTDGRALCTRGRRRRRWRSAATTAPATWSGRSPRAPRSRTCSTMHPIPACFAR